MNGGPFSGDLGSFRFKGTLPKGKSALVALKGRVADLSPVFGTATVAKDGTFAEIGSGRIPLDSIPRILRARNRCAAGPTAPARGLFLVEVYY